MAVGHAQQEIRTPDFPKDDMPLHTARLMADSRATLPTNDQLGRSSTAQEDVGLGDDILDRK
jgi:hypothetical protein